MQNILSDAIAVANGNPVRSLSGRSTTYQASGKTSSSTGAATIEIRGSLNGRTWDLLGTIALTLSTTETGDSFISQGAYDLVRADVTAISGTGATVHAWEGARG